MTLQPNPSVTSPHSSVTSPHPSVTSPHPSVTSPHSSVTSPHSFVTSSSALSNDEILLTASVEQPHDKNHISICYPTPLFPPSFSSFHFSFLISSFPYSSSLLSQSLFLCLSLSLSVSSSFSFLLSLSHLIFVSLSFSLFLIVSHSLFLFLYVFPPLFLSASSSLCQSIEGRSRLSS